MHDNIIIGFSGYSLEFPPPESVADQVAMGLWSPPPNESQHFTSDIVPYLEPLKGYQVFLNSLDTTYGVDVQEFWDAFKVCRLCDHIMLGELFVDHECDF